MSLAVEAALVSLADEVVVEWLTDEVMMAWAEKVLVSPDAQKLTVGEDWCGKVISIWNCLVATVSVEIDYNDDIQLVTN